MCSIGFTFEVSHNIIAMTSRQTTTILLSLLFLAAAVFAYYYYNAMQVNKQELPNLGQPGHVVGPFSFTDQDGHTVTDEDVAGKVRVVEYFFTTCQGICPEMNENMVSVYDTYKGNPRFVILSHTVNPEVDSVEVMKKYSEKFDADSRYWEFLTGDKKALYDMARYSYLITADDPSPEVAIADDFIHSEKFVLIDPQNRIRGQYDGTDKEEVKQLIKDVKILLETNL